MQILIHIGILLLSSFISAALAPKPPSPKPASLEDFNVPQSDQGIPQSVVFGTVRVRDPNVLWYGDLGTRPIRSRGGKK